MVTFYEISETDWQQAWEQGYRTTYFQSPSWFKLWQQLLPGAAVTAYKVRDSKNNALGVLPVLRRSSMGISRHDSSPAATYGGLIQSDLLQLSAETILQIGSRFTNMSWRLPPELSTGIAARDAGNLSVDPTHRLDLTPGMDSIEQIWQKGSYGIARDIRKANESGIQVFKAQYREEWQEYYELYLDNTRRWNPPPSVIYPFSLFEYLRSHEKQWADLWLALTPDEALIAGALCLRSPSGCVYWHGASSADHYHMRPVKPLIAEAIRDAVRRNLSFFDFNPSGGIAGVKRFKRNFGATEEPTLKYDNRSGLINAAGRVKSTLNRIRSRLNPGK